MELGKGVAKVGLYPEHRGERRARHGNVASGAAAGPSPRLSASTAKTSFVCEASSPEAEICFRREKWVWFYFSPRKLPRLESQTSGHQPPQPRPPPRACPRRPAGGRSWCPRPPERPARFGGRRRAGSAPNARSATLLRRTTAAKRRVRQRLLRACPGPPRVPGLAPLREADARSQAEAPPGRDAQAAPVAESAPLGWSPGVLTLGRSPPASRPPRRAAGALARRSSSSSRAARRPSGSKAAEGGLATAGPGKAALRGQRLHCSGS